MSSSSGIIAFKRSQRKLNNRRKKTARNRVIQQSATRYWDEHPDQWHALQERYLKHLTLRFIDFFVTTYARGHDCTYIDPVSGSAFNVYCGMQEALRSLNKEHLDPFKRTGRGRGESNDFLYRGMRTNAAQLTFFRWAFIHGVFDYMLEHHEEIEADRRLEDGDVAAAAAATEAAVIEIPMPPCLEDSEIGAHRVLQTYQECMQQPKRKRKRIREAKIDAYANVSSGGAALVQFDRVLGTSDLKKK